ncbi:hypothetical protein ACWDTI_02725 [Gordonia sp. NPDC003424]
MTSTVEEIAQKAIVRRAQQRLLAIAEVRDAHRLEQSEKSQREIAVILQTTQPRVGRLLREARELGETTTPEEIILRATVEGTCRSLLVERLCALDYSFTESTMQHHGSPKQGPWAQVVAAHRLGLLGDAEYEVVRSAVRPPAATVSSRQRSIEQ